MADILKELSWVKKGIGGLESRSWNVVGCNSLQIFDATPFKVSVVLRERLADAYSTSFYRCEILSHTTLATRFGQSLWVVESS